MNSALRERGSKSAFADRLGISKVYLSMLCDPFDVRTPSDSLAEAIARSLPVDPEWRDALLFHLQAAALKQLEISRRVADARNSSSVTDLVVSLRHAHSAATHGVVNKKGLNSYAAVWRSVQEILQQSHQSADVLAHVELRLIAHDVLCILNRPDEALFHAKYGRALLASSPTNRTRFGFDIEAMNVNLVRAESIAYRHLGLSKQSYEAALEAEELVKAERYSQNRWSVHLSRDRIAALASRPRFALRDLESIANEAKAACESNADPMAPLWSTLINRSLANGYLRYGREDRAGLLLQPLLDSYQSVQGLGALHQVMILETLARWHAALNDQLGEENFLSAAYEIADRAGLLHQVSRLTVRAGDLRPTLTKRRFN